MVRADDPAQVEAWLERARQLSSRDLEQHVAVCALGDMPPADPEAGEARVRVCFELEAVEAQQLRDALQVLRAQLGGEAAAGEDLEDGALLAAMARRVLHEAPPDCAPTPPRYQVAVLRCPDCARVRGQDAPLSETLAAEACCDAEVVDLTPGPTHGHRARTVPPAVRRAVLLRDGRRCVVPGCCNRLWLDVHHLRPRARGGSHAVDNLVTLCAAHHRLLHDGHLGLGFEDGRLVVRAADGRVRRCTNRAHG